MSTATKRPDEDIRGEIIAELRWNPLLDADRVMVWLLDGVVVLTGSVRTPDDAWKASLIASKVRGVRCVTNHLQLSDATSAPASQTPEPRESLRVLTCEIMVPRTRVDVRVEAGRVTFEGAVDWRAHGDAVERVAHRSLPNRRLTVLRALPRPPRWECEDWLEDANTREPALTPGTPSPA